MLSYDQLSSKPMHARTHRNTQACMNTHTCMHTYTHICTHSNFMEVLACVFLRYNNLYNSSMFRLVLECIDIDMFVKFLFLLPPPPPGPLLFGGICLHSGVRTSRCTFQEASITLACMFTMRICLGELAWKVLHNISLYVYDEDLLG